MTSAMMPTLPKADTKGRVERLQRAMRAHDVDVCVVMRPGNIAYFLDMHIIYRTLLVVYQDGEPDAIYWYLDAARLRSETWPRNVHLWGYEKEGGFKDPGCFEVLGRVLDERGLSRSKVAIELAIGQERTAPGLLYATEERALRQALPEAQIVNASRVIDDVLLYKDNAEVQLLRHTTGIAEASLLAGFAAVSPGRTELEVVGAVHAEMGYHNATPWPMAPTEVISGPRATYQHNITTYPSERAFEPGDMLLIDLHPQFRNHISDLCLPAVLGEPTSQQRRLADAWEAVVETLLKNLKPGNQAGEAALAAQKKLDDTGFADFGVYGFYGHGLGTCTRVPPIIRPNNEDELPENTVVVAGFHLYQPGVGGCRLEYPVLLSGGGCEPLSSLEPRLRVIELE